jgi:hypothetical protein
MALYRSPNFSQSPNFSWSPNFSLAGQESFEFGRRQIAPKYHPFKDGLCSVRFPFQVRFPQTPSLLLIKHLREKRYKKGLMALKLFELPYLWAIKYFRSFQIKVWPHIAH